MLSFARRKENVVVRVFNNWGKESLTCRRACCVLTPPHIFPFPPPRRRVSREGRQFSPGLRNPWMSSGLLAVLNQFYSNGINEAARDSERGLPHLAK
ncbi:hypothetical protein CEXT_171551 [Caerostris extrusa]|uniref:Uncharacterized protein n=1 Tax=Caerostris extrusa TaxID=172846 RepID=A0AAV4R0H9_CAEEX|nr:hypothetical protein CEXT_171551 [Caerostris extrusa]